MPGQAQRPRDDRARGWPRRTTEEREKIHHARAGLGAQPDAWSRPQHSTNLMVRTTKPRERPGMRPRRCVRAVPALALN